MGNQSSKPKSKKYETAAPMTESVRQNVQPYVYGIFKRFKRGKSTRIDVAAIFVSLISIVYFATWFLSLGNKLWSSEDKVEIWRQRATYCEASYRSPLLNVFLVTCCIWLLYLLKITEEFSAIERKHVIETMQAENERDVAIAEKSSKEELLNHIKKRAKTGEEEINRMKKERTDHQNSNSYRLAQGLDGAVAVAERGLSMLQSARNSFSSWWNGEK